ncbi:3'(2'),5'-bisphosphate nucleotidase CysQ [Sulfuricurvum sp.]|uniref:3'(2'),5'-bisphosphate nucleotidase CysQ n=1 Tax=Sulfuricurvum sp. TaxID=2025608 RepID=UPI0026122E32|nr:3'(2'),5'-bisphosphate nucleotidase CysQ [Sulfuricurvum sp.]MDD2782528.1 3'(2'),5'-bisphosphate nucleotidase CysQ [Sulfuricurvum sp.]
MFEQINIKEIVEIARKAGEVIMDIYRKDFSVEYKEDKSPLTEADKKANDVITEALAALPVVFPILSEEGRAVPYEVRREWDYFWMVDPLDGTKEFIKKNDEFTVNIALIHKGVPVLGVVYAPALGDMYWAKQGEGAFKNTLPLPLEKNHSPEKELRVVASKSHLSLETETFIDELRKTTQELRFLSKGSSLKLVMVAEGSADIYPRMAPTMEWDTAAADAIVREAGKMTYQDQNNTPIIYNKENLLNPWFIVH